ncbi:hypothetical protein BDV36DRAFT_260633 [Aspergillus pseudocaelatus]|uniref:Uncharacterized protein n=1 Tax=Aspergillus pseudocaelatus TaxID=1825620 RepID=A0ABQ6WGJ6_9EURO|nr:hypothetical protein BDV36DRAFT_260633 [Aspergillus pseudocaelatus]
MKAVALSIRSTTWRATKLANSIVAQVQLATNASCHTEYVIFPLVLVDKDIHGPK